MTSAIPKEIKQSSATIVVHDKFVYTSPKINGEQAKRGSTFDISNKSKG